MDVNFDSNIDAVIKETGEVFERDVPFALSWAMNSAMFDARRRIVNSTYPNAFTVRNKAFPGRLWRITKRADKRDLMVSLTQRADMGADYMVNHATGGIKRPTRGASVAVPRDIQRTKTGRIPVGKKPRRIRDKKKAFVVQRGSSRLVMERNRDKSVRLWYVLTPQAQIDKTFRFYEDGMDTLMRTLDGHFRTKMLQIARSAKKR